MPISDAELPLDDVDLEVHLIHHGSARTPLPGAPTVGKRCSAVLRGVSHEGRLIDGGACDRNRMVTQGAETAI